MNIFSGTSVLADSLSQFLEVKNQLFEIALVVNVETVPEISTDYYSSKSEFLGNLEIFQTHASQGVYLLVYESCLGCILKLQQIEGRLFIFKLNTVEDVFMGKAPLGSDSNVFLPMMIVCPVVSIRNRVMSDGMA